MDRQDRKWLRKYLHVGTTTVNFTKTNGENRTMVCTLNLDQIPGDKIPTDGQPPHRQPDSDVQRVFDLEIGEWRSFRFDSVNWFMEGNESAAA